MLWLVFPELQNVVGEFYFRVSGEVNRVSGKNGSRKRQVRGANAVSIQKFLGAECTAETAKIRQSSFSGNWGRRWRLADSSVGSEPSRQLLYDL